MEESVSKIFLHLPFHGYCCWSSNVNSNGFFFWVGWQQFFHNLELLVEDDSDDDQFTAKELPFLEICNFGCYEGPHYADWFYLQIFPSPWKWMKKVPKKTQFSSTWQRWHSSSERSLPKIHFKMEWWSAVTPTAFQKVYHQQEDQG